jgi:hypothetical protein
MTAAFQVTLVVLGVLIALAANDWNGGRLERKDEQKVLCLLRQDVARDSARLESDIRFARAQWATAAEFVDLVSHDTHTGTAWEPVLVAIDGLGRFSPTPFADGTYRDLVAGGRLAIIRHQRVHEALHEYYSAVARQERLNELYRDRLWAGFQPYVIGAFPLGVQRSIINAEEFSISAEEVERLLHYFRSADGADLHIRGAYRTYALIEVQYSRLLRMASDLIPLIDEAASARCP